MPDIRTRPGKKLPYQVRYVDLTTKSGFGYQSFLTTKEAKNFAASCQINENSAGQLNKRILVGEAVDKWLNICEKIGRDGREIVEPQTLVEYQRRAKVICQYPWKKHIHQLLPADIIDFRTWLLENKSRDLARRSLSSFHSVILEMKIQGYLHTDPAAGITIRADGRYDSHEIDIPSDTEMSNLFSALDAMASSTNIQRTAAWRKFRPMYYLAGFTGMRPSEYRGFPWVSFNDRYINITQRADKDCIIGPVKSKAAKRTIIIPSITSDIVAEWQEFTKGSGEQLAFGRENNKPQYLSNLYRGSWAPLLREADLMKQVQTNQGLKNKPKYTMYCLRHYFASKLIERGKDFKYIQKVMGHSTIEITFNTYGHLIKGNEEAHKADADDMAASILN